MKRFTETEKWRDTWFRKLNPRSKLAFIYIIDNCDAAGVWDPDCELANFTIGEDVPWDEVFKEFGARVEKLKSGKWHLTRFVEFQYGELTMECRPHVKVLGLLRGHGIPYGKGIGKGIHTHKTRQEEDRKKTGPEEEPPAAPPVTAEDVYSAYPRKEAKQEALRAITKAGEKNPLPKLLAATKAYAAAVAQWPPDDQKYVPHPATWFNRGSYDDDPASWVRGQKTNSYVSQPPANLR